MKRRWMLAAALFALGLVVGAVGFGALLHCGVLSLPSGPGNPVSIGPPARTFKLDPVGLLNSPQIKKELAVTDEQMTKFPEAMQEALAKILSEKQMTRLHQIELQRRGLSGMTDNDIAAVLKLTDEQDKSIKKILEDTDKERRDAFPGGTGGTLAERMAKMDGIKTASYQKAQGVLTADQKKTWLALNGEWFQMQFPSNGANPKKK
jgi:hypothetical protein